LLRLQDTLFEWIASQPALTGMVVLAAGALYGLLGFRLLRFLLVLACVGVGSAIGLVAAAFLEQPPAIPIALGALALGGVGAAWKTPAAVITTTAVWAVLGTYLAAQFGLRGTGMWAVLGTAGAIGLVLSLVSRQAMAVLVTTLLGAGLMIVGFVGVASTVIPTFGSTFRVCARNQSYLVPILLAMVTATLYSCQARARQGDIRTGL